MSIYKPKNSPYWHFDFQVRNRRIFGTTGCRNRREAEAIERGERARAQDLIRQSAGGSDTLTIDLAAGKYWTEVGQHHVNSKDTYRDLDRLIEYFGKTTRLVEITNNEVAKLVAWRRGHRVRGQKKDKSGHDLPLISPATVNRTTTQVLQKIFTRAVKFWGMRYDHEPNWRQHRLREPVERVRELQDDEADRLWTAMRPDYVPLFSFVHASGMRFGECILKWSAVNWKTRQISTIGKNGSIVIIPITSVLSEILVPLQGHHGVWVFTYIADRTRDGRARGQRYPITYSGAQSQWKRTQVHAKVDGFRIHDFRHDLASKLLRETGNLKLVQRALNHKDIKTTTRYAHVLTDEVAEGLERTQKSRLNSRSMSRKVS